VGSGLELVEAPEGEKDQLIVHEMFNAIDPLCGEHMLNRVPFEQCGEDTLLIKRYSMLGEGLAKREQGNSNIVGKPMVTTVVKVK
jgi:hypothetical protein